MLTEKNYFALSETEMTYQKTNDIVHDFINDENENFGLLKNALVENIGLVGYVYWVYFPKIYNRTNIFSIRNKTVFDYNYELWRNEKLNQPLLLKKKKLIHLLKIQQLMKNG